MKPSESKDRSSLFGRTLSLTYLLSRGFLSAPRADSIRQGYRENIAPIVYVSRYGPSRP
jgi:hypothetical protein